MPFGLCNAAQTWMRFIHEVLRSLDYYFVYLDDILIASTDTNFHKKHVRDVLQRLDDYSLTINAKLIANYKQPTTVRNLRKFLGILNFYRKFLPKAAHIQAPLQEFLKNSKKNDKREVEWNVEAISAFNQCKNQLANVTLLAHPSQDADLTLMTDASDIGLGASLNEITSDGFKPLGHCDNVPADAFSRISAIVTLSTIDYEEFAQMQQGDDELKALLSATNQTLQLKQLRMPGSTTEIYCDISTSTVRPYVPHALRRNVFLAVHNLSHPGIRATAKLISKRFVWTSMNKDIQSWTCSCIPCQRVKIQRHTNSELGHFKVPDARFHHLHLDIIGPLPPSQGFFLLPYGH
ncbi:hypothetical protein TNIN_376681 [Trichonephila inaurata madagascariensis]|uniref:RNA-directed DNA polymerase n=1 Tax=Trichonephila inaurata madagascariensis TaxID=2747483 RepID=A0A8X7BQX9_9ARAC|nr:hypothetical protein TNIN_32451 [Trichonephila inaurata madagascariensis]GFY57322.1 hypothetical protein TNIN_376681 [Trichonephila inaurata madagascariensis]